MGRVIKTVSADGSSASAGLSTSDVTTLIKNNTSWQYIETVTASNSSTLDLIHADMSNHDAFQIYFDNVNFTAMTNARMYLFISGSLANDSNYNSSVSMGSTTSGTNTGQGSFSGGFIYGGQTYNWQYNICGPMFVNGKSGNRKTMSAHLGGGNSGSGAMRASFGGNYTGNNSGTITGFRFYNASGNIESGSFHLYGLNKHD